MKTQRPLGGIVPPVVTPLDKNENVDPAGLKRVLDYVVGGGVHGVFVNGSNGEFYGLDFENQKKATEVAIEHVGDRVPVYAGASAITTKDAIRLARMAESAGADALTVLTPMFITPTEDELYEHFRTIAESVRIPVVLYNNPGKTGNTITAGLMNRLVEIDGILGVKNTSMDFSLTMKYIEIGRQKNDFAVFGGIDYYIYATMAHGGVGSVAGTANVAPALVVEIYEKYMEGDLKGSLDAQRRLMPLRDAYGLGSFPVMMKVCLNLLGLDVGEPMKPVHYVDTDIQEKAKDILRDIGLLN